MANKPHTGADYYNILLHLFWAACFSYLSKTTNLKILVTGASGFIGSPLVRKLLASSSANNYQITCMKRNAESLKDYFNDKKGPNIAEVEMSAIINSL